MPISSRLDRFIKAKKLSIKLIASLDNFGYEKWANRMRNCSPSFRIDYFPEYFDIEENGLKIRKLSHIASFSQVFYCQVPICPVCCLARSIKMGYLLSKKLHNEKCLFATLTQKNILLSDLTEEFHKIQWGWNRLINRKLFSNIKGYIRKLEVTFNDGFCHPHQHIIIPCDKFLIKNQELRIFWQKALNLNYLPQCDIRRLNSKGLYEFSKYFFKPSDLMELNENQLRLFLDAKKKTRFLSSGGQLKNIGRSLKNIEESIITGEEQKVYSDLFDYFCWNDGKLINKAGEIYRNNIMIYT